MRAEVQYRRLAAVVVLLLAGFGWLAWRMFQIQITRHEELSAKADRFTQFSRPIEAWRGEIRDRNGTVLAISVPMKTVYLNVSLCTNRVDAVAGVCGSLFGVPKAELAARLRSSLQNQNHGGAGTRAIMIQRELTPEAWQTATQTLAKATFGFDLQRLTSREKGEFRKLRHEMVFARETQVRRYLYGDCLAGVLGFVCPGTKSTGLAGVDGVEKACDTILAGQPGRCVSAQNAAGQELPLRRTEYTAPIDGNNVVLSIDIRVQSIVEAELRKAVAKAGAHGGSAIIMDPRTFEILAVASFVNEEPKNPNGKVVITRSNPAFNDAVEPGSTFKLVTLSAALDQGLLSLDSPIDCENGHARLQRVSVHDHAALGVLPLRLCFAKSSNIGFAKVAWLMGKERFAQYARSFGFGRRTGMPFVSETSGSLDSLGKTNASALLRGAFGQGIAVSQVQMASAMAAVANEGRMLRPTLVSRIESKQGKVVQEFGDRGGRQVVRPETARAVREALEVVISREGTGARAAMEKFTVAAKTGTAQKSDRHGYIPGAYYSSMIGFLPAEQQPQLVIAVALDEPRNGYYAGDVVAPVFRAIAEEVTECLGIPPDKAVQKPAPLPLPSELALKRSAPTVICKVAASNRSRTHKVPTSSQMNLRVASSFSRGSVRESAHSVTAQGGQSRLTSTAARNSASDGRAHVISAPTNMGSRPAA